MDSPGKIFRSKSLPKSASSHVTVFLFIAKLFNENMLKLLINEETHISLQSKGLKKVSRQATNNH